MIPIIAHLKCLHSLSGATQSQSKDIFIFIEIIFLVLLSEHEKGQGPTFKNEYTHSYDSANTHRNEFRTQEFGVTLYFNGLKISKKLHFKNNVQMLE